MKLLTAFQIFNQVRFNRKSKIYNSSYVYIPDVAIAVGYALSYTFSFVSACKHLI